MSKVLFINGNAHGHVNPTLPIVKELKKRNEQVYYCSTLEFRSQIENTGAAFVDYGYKLTDFFKGFKPSGNHPFYTLIEFMLEMDRVAIPLLVNKANDLGIDYIIHDSMFGEGNIVAQKLNKPAICSCSSYAMNKPPLPPYMLTKGFHPQLDILLEKMSEAAKEWGKPSLDIMDIFFKKEDLNLVYTSKEFQPDAQSFDNSFKFVGPSISKREETFDFSFNENVGKRKLIYISMGTINNNCIDFYKKCIDAFSKESFNVVMSVGNKTDITLLGHIPENFIVRNYIPQLEVLKRSDVFISHGGLNSVSEALFFGVPVVCIPQANDQPMVMRQLVQLGAGTGLKMEDITSQILRESVENIISDNGFKQKSRAVGDSFIEAGGYEKAADYIIEFYKQSQWHKDINDMLLDLYFLAAPFGGCTD
jgi:MGT family glycosyltransferase